ncbi:MAG TPA: 4'-phosphopantetheinyl transferase superfamily protein [Methylophilaceae bacterium]|jgi:4'-phosphopantetheinyl transferase
MRTLSNNIVQVWVERSDDYTDTSKMERLLSKEEHERASKFVHAHDRKDFIIAHGLKRKRIAENLGVKDPSKLRFAADETGKPYLLDADVHFNLSHSHGVSALAISTIAPCAVDIEVYRDINQLSMLIEKTMTVSEQNIIKTAPSQLKAFIDRWVVKEAFLKLSGVGLSVPLTSICTASEIKNSQSFFGTLRGAALFFKRGQDYSLAASSSYLLDFVMETPVAAELPNGDMFSN